VAVQICRKSPGQPDGAEEDAFERRPPGIICGSRDGPRRRSAHADQRTVQAAKTVPGGRNQQAWRGGIGIIRHNPGDGVSRGAVLREAGLGRSGRSLMRSAEHDLGPFSGQRLGRSEPKTAAAAGHEVNPAAQPEIHPAILPQEPGAQVTCAYYRSLQVTRDDRSLTEDGMEDAVTERAEWQVRSAFPDGAIARVQVLQYGDDPEVEPGQAAMRVFFDWPGRPEGRKADPKTVHAFVVANSAALDVLRDELPSVIRWVEFRPEGPAGAAGPHGLAYRITDRGRRAAAPDDFTPVMTRLGPADLATLDGLITAGIVNSRAEGVRWAIGRLREHPA
jgi:hypothetical protein